MDDKANIVVVSLPVSEKVSVIPEPSVEAIEATLSALKGRRLDLVLFPQYSGYGKSALDRDRKKSMFSSYAAELKCYIVYNTLVETGSGNRCVSVIVDREGHIIGEYVKTHLMDGIDAALELGDGMPVFTLDFGKVAVLAGSDLFIPELSEIYSLKGAEILLCSMGVMPLRDDTEQITLLRARAIANYMYVAVSTYASFSTMYMTNRYEDLHDDTKDYSEEELENSLNTNGLGKHTGRAAIYDLRGETIASTGREKGFVECEVNLTKKRDISKYIFGTGCIVFHQNKRGVFKDIVKEHKILDRCYEVKKPVVGIVHMKFSDTVFSKDRYWFRKHGESIRTIAHRCDIVVSSEFSRQEYMRGDNQKVEDQDEKLSLYASIAEEKHCYIAVNDCFDGINTSLLFDRKGEIIHRYVKINPTTMMYKQELPAGTEIRTVDTDFGRIGFTVCADSYCQEIARILGIKGVEVIINQTQSWGYDANSINEGVFRAWAVENCAYVVTSSFPLSQVKLRSNIIDPTGETVFSSVYDHEGIYTYELDLEAIRNKVSMVYRNDKVVKDYRFKRRLLDARRPELYGLLNGN